MMVERACFMNGTWRGVVVEDESMEDVFTLTGVCSVIIPYLE